MKFVNDKHIYNCRIICPHKYSSKSSEADGPRGTEENGSPGMEINLPGGSPGNTTGGVNLSGTTLPEIEIQGSYTGSGIVFGKPAAKDL